MGFKKWKFQNGGLKQSMQGMGKQVNQSSTDRIPKNAERPVEVVQL